MKRLISILGAIVALAAVGGVAAAPASAGANCTFSLNVNIWSTQGVWMWQAQAYGCTQVDKVEFRTTGGNTLAHSPKLITVNNGDTHLSCCGGGVTTGAIQLGERIYAANYTNQWFGDGCGFPAILVKKFTEIRIHNTAGAGSWGSFVPVTGGQQWLC